MKPVPIFLAVAVGFLGVSCAPRPGALAVSADAADAAAAGIRPEAIRAHIRFLADDLLEGRGPATRGYRLAAKYVAAQFEAAGLEPAGTDGSFFQPVPLRKVDLEPGKSSLSLTRNGRTQILTYAEDYQLDGWEANNFKDAETTVTAPVVFVGYGVTAPELEHDDYAGVDVQGKLVAMFNYAAPSSFPPDQRAYYASSAVKARNAADHGAVGLLAFLTPQDAERYSWDWTVPQFEMGSMSSLDPNGEPRSPMNGVVSEIKARVFLSRSGAEALFAGAPHSLSEVFAAADENRVLSFALPVDAAVETVTRNDDVTCANVAAMIRGSDPTLRDEFLVVTAHLDHLGVGEPVDGDAIYNGAYDNASGVAGLIEIARAFTHLPMQPPRSVIFVAVTGEEMGLLGADYFARHPTVPREKIVADLNMDELAIWYEPRDIVAYGSEHSSLSKTIAESTSHLGMTISPDPMPEEALFVRQDAYPFVLEGIPALWLTAGTQTGDPQLDGKAITTEWLQTRYHTPKDDFEQPMNFDAAAKHAGLYFLTAYEVARDPEWPVWNPGDFFGERFGARDRE